MWAEHHDAARHLDDECQDLWQFLRYEDGDAARASVETLTQLRDRIQEEAERMRTGPDHPAAGVLGALWQRPKTPPTAPPECRAGGPQSLADQVQRA